LSIDHSSDRIPTLQATRLVRWQQSLKSFHIRLTAEIHIWIISNTDSERLNNFTGAFRTWSNGQLAYCYRAILE
ncbi:unnamed protein product, partial [Ceratitis capitata]